MVSDLAKNAYHHGDLRAALLAAATDIITESGVDAVTMRGLAERAGVSRTAPYRHFEDKRALLTEVALEGYRRLAATMAAAREKGGDDPVAALACIGQQYVRFAVDNATHYRLMFGDGAVTAGDAPAIKSASKKAAQDMVEAIQAAQARGLLIDTDPKKLANLLWSASHGLANLLISGQLPRSRAAEYARYMTDSVSRGFLPRPDDQSAR